MGTYDFGRCVHKAKCTEKGLSDFLMPISPEKGSSTEYLSWSIHSHCCYDRSNFLRTAQLIMCSYTSLKETFYCVNLCPAHAHYNRLFQPSAAPKFTFNDSCYFQVAARSYWRFHRIFTFHLLHWPKQCSESELWVVGIKPSLTALFFFFHFENTFMEHVIECMHLLHPFCSWMQPISRKPKG